MNENGVIATEEDVLNCYRILLGREPEGRQVVEQSLSAKTPIWSLIRGFLESKEAIARLVTQAGHHISHGRYRNPVDVDGTPEQLDELLAHIRQVWAKYGDEEPYWSVLVHPVFLQAAMNADSEEVFYQSGRGNCDSFTDACTRNDVRQPTDGLVVDFGCGVGRLGEHLSTDFEKYLGVDISSPHLRLAKSRMHKLGRLNCDFQLLPDFLKSSTRFDAFMSLIVLQHNPPPVMVLLLNALLSRLNSGGVGYFQIPYFLFNYKFDISEYLQSTALKKSMEMHALPQRAVFKAIADNSCCLLEATLDGLVGYDGLSYTYLIKKT